MLQLIINADDYALDASVDEAVLALARRGVVTATSAMVLSPRWPEAARRLDPGLLDGGLHLDLTSDFATREGYGQPLPRLLARSVRRGLDAAEISRAVHRQLDLFELHAGRPPRFVDGHQHVHQLPGVRQALADTLGRRYGNQAMPMAVRYCVGARWRGFKAALIAALGGRPLQRLGARRGWMANSDFVGVYDFADSADLPRLWADWLTGLGGSLPLAMCHVAAPGHAHDPGDPIHAARLREFAWLQSDAFRELCERHGIAPARWPTSAPVPTP
jgi:predicted glycoside hydrolase/deacetylase ChbG (UPF0249 family)